MNPDLRTHACAHGPCACEIPLDRTWCSEHCATHAAQGGEHDDCDCGHAGCKPPPVPDPSEPV